MFDVYTFSVNRIFSEYRKKTCTLLVATKLVTSKYDKVIFKQSRMFQVELVENKSLEHRHLGSALITQRPPLTGKAPPFLSIKNHYDKKNFNCKKKFFD